MNKPKKTIKKEFSFYLDENLVQIFDSKIKPFNRSNFVTMLIFRYLEKIKKDAGTSPRKKAKRKSKSSSPEPFYQ